MLEHLSHLGVLAQQVVNFLDAGAGSACDAFAAAAIDDLMMQALVLSHRIDNCFYPVKLFFVHFVGVLLHSGEWTNAGQHSHQTLEGAHFLYLPQLIAKVLQRKAITRESSAGHFLRFLLVNILFRFFDQRENVAHAENAGDDAIGMEGLERVVLFAHSDELDRLTGHLADGQGRAPTGIAIHLGQDNSGEREFFMELVRRLDGILASHGIGDKQDFLRVEHSLERLHLVHELIVNV